MFPNLAKELEQESVAVKINSNKPDSKVKEKIASETFRGYNPDIIDFLRRCNTLEEANEIIDYMEKQKKLSAKYANKFRRQLKEKGIKSFGAKKEKNYYSLRGKN
jgi:hypothetical protein